MKKILLISLLFSSCASGSTEKAKTEAISYQVQIKQATQDSLLINIQDKIYTAFVQAMVSQDNKSLLAISSKLETLNKTKKQNLILYWRAYLQFYSAIYYLKKGDKETSDKEIDKGVDWLEEMPKKNSEDYTLLSMLQGFAIQFKGISAMFVSKDMKKM